MSENDLEVYTPINIKTAVNIKVSWREYISQPLNLDLEQAKKKDINNTITMYRKDVKCFNFNYVLSFRQGTYVIDIFTQAILIDELFQPFLFTQKGRKSEDSLQRITLDLEQNTGGALDYLKSKFTSKNNTVHSMSDIYIVPLPRSQILVSDPKDKYTITTVSTSKLGISQYD